MPNRKRPTILSTLYGNEVPPQVLKSAEKRFQKYAKKFEYSPDNFPTLKAYSIGSGFEDFRLQTILDDEVDPQTAKEINTEKAVTIGTIRMGFGHCRIALALASAAHALGYTPYWIDLLSFPNNAATKTIRHMENLYNLGSRISQRSKFFNKYIWEYITSSAGQKLTFTAKERSTARIFSPIFTTLDNNMPFLATHPWVGHGAVSSGMKNVVTVVPDNFPLAFHVVPGSVHTVQSPSAYMGYRTFNDMDTSIHFKNCMPKENIVEVGHYIDHEIVSNIEKDCALRLKRIKDKDTRRFLLTMGGAGAQVLRFADIIISNRRAIEKKQAVFFINMGDHKGRWNDLKNSFESNGVEYILHNDWKETRSFIDEHREKAPNGVHVFLHDNFYAAIYATNLLMRISDVMITKPSELSFYPVPKLFIQRVGKHEAWGAIRGSEIGDGTIETENNHSMHKALKLLIEEDDLLEMYCNHIMQNHKIGMYDGAYKAIQKAVEMSEKNR